MRPPIYYTAAHLCLQYEHHCHPRHFDWHFRWIYHNDSNKPAFVLSPVVVHITAT